MVRVLRYREGQELLFFDGQGGRFQGRIESIHPDGSISGRLSELPPAPAALSIELYQGLIKASRWEWVLEKGTELGVSAFIPVVCARSVVIPRDGRLSSQRQRWERIALSAAKQSRRASLPVIREPVSFERAIGEARTEGAGFFAWERRAEGGFEELRGALSRARGSRAKRARLFVGPEGGFEPGEAEQAGQAGLTLFGLGPRVLRAETAAIAAVSILLYELEAE